MSSCMEKCVVRKNNTIIILPMGTLWFRQSARVYNTVALYVQLSRSYATARTLLQYTSYILKFCRGCYQNTNVTLSRLFMTARGHQANRTTFNDVCFNCGYKGHWSGECPARYASRSGGFRKTGGIKPPQASREIPLGNDESVGVSECESCVFIEVRAGGQNKGEIHSNDSLTPHNGSPMSVKGRLKSHIKFWEAIGAPQYILSTIEHGYKIPFQT